MVIVAAADRKLSPAPVAVHGTNLCARNGQDLTSSSNEKWARCIVNNLLRQHVGVSLMFFHQAYEVLCLPTRHTPHVKCHTPHATRHTTHIARHLSNVKRHTPLVKR
jgi:hypothetical protein